MRERCYQCFRPISFCFCHTIPRIDNRTGVLILQHIGERFHPFNTARIVRKALQNCQLIVDHNRRLGTYHLPIRSNAGLLYPGADAPALDQLPVALRPSQLVIIDGTWNQAKTIVRDVPQLQQLPCYRLSPSTPGRYRIRREPDAQSLSTLEATVQALKAIEPDTVGLEQLLAAFNSMVETQLGHGACRAEWRRREKRDSRPRNLPVAMSQSPERLVVAYGEATPGQRGERAASPAPVNWVAQRFGTTEHFACTLQQERPLTDTMLRHMELSQADFDDAVPVEEFRNRWKQFFHRNDVLVVYHPRTSQLLRHIEPPRHPSLILKSIYGRWQTRIRSLEDLIELEGVTSQACDHSSRAKQRLAMSVALVKHLIDHHSNASSIPDA